VRLAVVAAIACCCGGAPAKEAAAKKKATPQKETWLRGTTHVHAHPSGDSKEPLEGVLKWYEDHHYDFIALTDHNRVTEVGADTHGRVAVRVPPKGLIVLAGIELTHNPEGCLPAGDETGRCRIHVNALGVTARPTEKVDWAERRSKQRIDMYQAAFNEARTLGASVVQINHPNYYWGMTPELLVEISKHAQLLEIANTQFETWNAGDATHPSVESQWDIALSKGIKIWGVASDDAHDYHDEEHGKYPPGGGWVMVKAKRDPQAILDALAKGRFYSTTGVTLARAEVDGEELVVEVAPDANNQYTIAFIENGKQVASVNGTSARRAVPQTGYVRAVVTRDDGKRAWVQPASR